jgi:ParB-like chromosome segregation protein Spo0J
MAATMSSAPVFLGPEVELPIAKLIPGKKFRELDPVKVAEIQASLPEQGLLYALIVKPPNPEGFYKISDGDHRYFACKQAGWTTIRSRVGSADDVMAGMQGVVGNLLRNEKVDYTRLGDWFKEALQAPGWDVARIARTAGKTTDWVNDQIRRADAIDPKLHGRFITVIPRTLTDDFAKIPREKQAEVFERIKKRKAADYLRTEVIRRIIQGHQRIDQPRAAATRVHLCQRCHGIIMKEEIDLGEVTTVMRDSGLEYVHTDPADCHFTTTFVITHTGEVPKAKVQEQIGFFREKLEELGATITVYGRHLHKTWPTEP